ncbi:hypothetical protein ACFLYE_00250 [Chloroflexota bacterium]
MSLENVKKHLEQAKPKKKPMTRVPATPAEQALQETIERKIGRVTITTRRISFEDWARQEEREQRAREAFEDEEEEEQESYYRPPPAPRELSGREMRQQTLARQRVIRERYRRSGLIPPF